MQHFIFSHLQPFSAIFSHFHALGACYVRYVCYVTSRWHAMNASDIPCRVLLSQWQVKQVRALEDRAIILTASDPRRSMKIPGNIRKTWEHHGWNTFLFGICRKKRWWTVSTCLYFEHLWAFAYRHPEPLSLPSDVEVTDSHWDFWVMGKRGDPILQTFHWFLFFFSSFFFWHSHPFSSVRSSATAARRIWSAFAWPAVPMCSFSEERADIRADALPVIGYHWVSLGMLYSYNMLQYVTIDFIFELCLVISNLGIQNIM